MSLNHVEINIVQTTLRLEDDFSDSEYACRCGRIVGSDKLHTVITLLQIGFIISSDSNSPSISIYGISGSDAAGPYS